MGISLRNKIHLMICGPTGTGKTVNIVSELNKIYNDDKASYAICATSFSGQTTANQTQKLIESKVCTRRRKGYYGPEEGR